MTHIFMKYLPVKNIYQNNSKSQETLGAIQKKCHGGEGERGYLKLVTKSDKGGDWVSLKSDVITQKEYSKFLNYSNRPGAKTRPCTGSRRKCGRGEGVLAIPCPLVFEYINNTVF